MIKEKHIEYNRKIILYIAMSLDGYIADKEGGVDWLVEYSSPQNEQDYNKFYDAIDTVVMGRVTYEQVLSFDMAYPYSDRKSYVFSRSIKGQDENSEFINMPAEELVDKLKSQNGKNVWLVGGADMVDEFIDKDLIDEYYIAVMPIILGDGIPLFKKRDTKLHLETCHSKTAQGYDMLVYRKKQNV